jgi:hypothetical protein
METEVRGIHRHPAQRLERGQPPKSTQAMFMTASSE